MFSVQAMARKQAVMRSATGLMGLALVVVLGCGSSPPEQRFEVALPEEFEIDGKSWYRQEWSEAEDRLTASFFRRKPYMAENPAFSGLNVCYSDGRNVKRLYWVDVVGRRSSWALLEFKGRSASGLVEGTGAPFEDLVLKDIKEP